MAASGTGPCTPETIERISSDTNFNAWKGATDTSLNAISSAAGVSRPPTPEEISALEALEADVRTTGGCITEKKQEFTGATNNISMAQEGKLALEKKIKEAEEDVVIARDRIGYIKHPEREPSFYGSWFPLNRPVNEKSIPILIVITLIFIVAGLYFLSPLVGISINVSIDTYIQEIMNTFLSQFTPVTIVLLFVIIFTFYYVFQQRSASK